jgi:type IV secretion system protein VirB6
MGFIESTYSSVVAFLAGIGQTQFAAVAGGIAGSAQILATIIAIAVIVNMSMQYRPIDMGTSITLIWKMILVALFLQNWTQFDAITSAFFDLMESVSTAFLDVATGTSSSTQTSFAASLDQLTDQMAAKASVTASRLNIVGQVINGINLLLIAIFGAISMIAMVVARVVLTVLIALGPLAIMASLSDKSKNLFEAWASAMMAMLLFPVLIAGVFATIVGLARSSISGADPNTIGDLGPIMMTIVSAIILVMATPFILTQITGSFQLSGFAARIAGGTLSGSKLIGDGMIRSGRGGESRRNEARSSAGSSGPMKSGNMAAAAANAATGRNAGASDRGAKAAQQMERQRRMVQDRES